MQKGLIITCPKHDDATEYLAYFSKEIIKEAENKSLALKEIEDKNLNFKDFSKILSKVNYKLIVLNGHGSTDSIFGYKDNIILAVGKNEHLVKERIVYARSCDAGRILGKKCMESTKEGCFIGYQLPFVFFMDEKWSAKPSNDHVAKIFLDPSNQVPISIIKGSSGSDANYSSKKQMLKMINKLLSGNQDRETPLFLEALWNNYTGQILHGNPDAKL